MAVVAYDLSDDIDGEIRQSGKCDESRLPIAGPGQTLTILSPFSDPPLPGKHRRDPKTKEIIALSDRIDPDAVLKVLERLAAKAIESGFKSNALGAEYTYGSTLADQIRLLQGGAQRCADESGKWLLRPHTQNQIDAARADFISMRDAALEKLDAIVAQAKEAKSTEELEGIRLDA